MRLATSRVLGVTLASCLVVPMSGCRTYSEVRDTRLTAEAAATPTMELCLEYLASPGGTHSQRARAEILAQRGETCQAYLGAAQVRAAANAGLTAAEAQRRAVAFEKGMEMLMQTPRPLAPPAQIPQGTHTYFINGEAVTCQTMGAMTDCH